MATRRRPGDAAREVDVVRHLAGVPAPTQSNRHWNKFAPSERQLGDVAGVVAAQKGPLDEAYLRRSAADLRVLDTLEDALRGHPPSKAT